MNEKQFPRGRTFPLRFRPCWARDNHNCEFERNTILALISYFSRKCDFKVLGWDSGTLPLRPTRAGRHFKFERNTILALISYFSRKCYF